MPRNPLDPPFKSKLNARKRKDNKHRYETSVPIPVAERKGKWSVSIDEDNTITWDVD